MRGFLKRLTVIILMFMTALPILAAMVLIWLFSGKTDNPVSRFAERLFWDGLFDSSDKDDEYE